MIQPLLAGKFGLEIGGPSTIFRKGRLIPVYDRCSHIDSCNFSGQTIWSSSSEQSYFGPCLRSQFVAEASALKGVADRTYDFVLASHVLEHVANPLAALSEWKRVLTPTGLVVVIVPDKRATFDHHRPFTTFEHIEKDYLQNTPEGDLTHLDEILAMHDLNLDPPAGSPQEFRERCLRNATVRAMHHHVFSTEILTKMLDRVGFQPSSVAAEKPEHIIAFARRAS